ncbi:MAG TPA: LuxR C-terminal-related transcriptional regulator [Candidatus Baltobacteraceae bacterium]|nr:LuxR C-terminal-related transcriptional regulator [Candidatus Baltobacteraceae bacterium]
MPLKLGESAEALVGIDEGGLVAYWNEAAAKLLGRSERDAVGRPCHELLQGLKPSGGHLCGPNCAVREACKSARAPRRFEMVVPQADGTELWVQVTTVVVYDDERPMALHLLSESVAAQRLTDLAETVVRRIGQPDAPADDFALTRREGDVLALLAEGLRTPEIAGRLQLAPTTVRSHIQNLLPKLGVHSRAEAVIFALKHGLVHLH